VENELTEQQVRDACLEAWMSSPTAPKSKLIVGMNWTVLVNTLNALLRSKQQAERTPLAEIVERIEKQPTHLLTDIWNCVDYDASGNAWLDNPRALARVNARLQPILDSLRELAKR